MDVNIKRDIKSLLPCELEDYFESTGEQKFRAKQVFSWLHKGFDFSQMNNISVALRKKLDDEFFISSLEMAEKHVSGIDGTVKYLWRLHDEETIESVLMDYSHGISICISSQVGCKMGCIFCASSIGGFVRNLSASEILDQVLFSQNDSGKRISNIVLMGMGEPLDNFENVMRFIKLICHRDGINIGARHITLSTCGLPENIDRLSEYDVQLTLAISLHAPDDETRTMLIPSNSKTNIRELLDAGDRYFNKTGRRVTYEYALIDGINDSTLQAELLSSLLKNTTSHLNLISLSGVKEHILNASTKINVSNFANILKKNNINFTVRRSLGCDIDASCGQLRRRFRDTAN